MDTVRTHATPDNSGAKNKSNTIGNRDVQNVHSRHLRRAHNVEKSPSERLRGREENQSNEVRENKGRYKNLRSNVNHRSKSKRHKRKQPKMENNESSIEDEDSYSVIDIYETIRRRKQEELENENKNPRGSSTRKTRPKLSEENGKTEYHNAVSDLESEYNTDEQNIQDVKQLQRTRNSENDLSSESIELEDQKNRHREKEQDSNLHPSDSRSEMKYQRRKERIMGNKSELNLNDAESDSSDEAVRQQKAFDAAVKDRRETLQSEETNIKRDGSRMKLKMTKKTDSTKQHSFKKKIHHVSKLEENSFDLESSGEYFHEEQSRYSDKSKRIFHKPSTTSKRNHVRKPNRSIKDRDRGEVSSEYSEASQSVYDSHHKYIIKPRQQTFTKGSHEFVTETLADESAVSRRRLANEYRISQPMAIPNFVGDRDVYVALESKSDESISITTNQVHPKMSEDAEILKHDHKGRTLIYTREKESLGDKYLSKTFHSTSDSKHRKHVEGFQNNKFTRSEVREIFSYKPSERRSSLKRKHFRRQKDEVTTVKSNSLSDHESEDIQYELSEEGEQSVYDSHHNYRMKPRRQNFINPKRVTETEVKTRADGSSRWSIAAERGGSQTNTLMLVAELDIDKVEYFGKHADMSVSERDTRHESERTEIHVRASRSHSTSQLGNCTCNCSRCRLCKHIVRTRASFEVDEESEERIVERIRSKRETRKSRVGHGRGLDWNTLERHHSTSALEEVCSALHDVLTNSPLHRALWILIRYFFRFGLSIVGLIMLWNITTYLPRIRFVKYSDSDVDEINNDPFL